MKRYPYAEKWSEAQNAELGKLDAAQEIKWIPNIDLPKGTKLPNDGYRYNRTPAWDIIERKARCSITSDPMRLHEQYTREHKPAPMTDNTAAIRMLLAMKAAHGLRSEQFDIKSPYVHETWKYGTKVYVKQHPIFDGTYKHNCKGGQLHKKLYSNPSRESNYLQCAQRLLTKTNIHRAKRIHASSTCTKQAAKYTNRTEN